MFKAPKAIKECTTSGNAASFTTARVGGGSKKVIWKPTEKKKSTGLKPDALTKYVSSGYKKA
jgi:hypothetical protein